ncbi:MAG: TetR family transcriptional regulator [Hydrogenophaga sp.]|uniref:TetR/AcrR family transcriptional regulator n=1 Tax=Hydrogenophaga sp. TaxID=1904254 RepID=UPI0016BB8D90|nr:TetR/AcrR family transcriptional regulator [Hydrogenophaga sp.]NIM41791.1 TetR family transcriptional regulator [Hydrogenophaga sp.]NIN27096.1 TetR family transcriptional regulator [Hydrogenophaga sp.]NIN31797.1 TetR family transcriptional regulator [Hydrogenophaga sp.]NIN56041.1 TetR family transcriptional regulator [Hydrogenophaga sp.]NIO52168.1 TetR family transcriptional regulator [Hydrogenophaga sp.]
MPSPAPTLPPEAPRRTRRKEARPGELIEAALSLFVEKGFAATRVEEVAACAGVSKGTLFLYFPSKEDLFKAVVRETVAGRFPEWADELAEFQGDSVELVRYAMHTWWERVGMTPASGITKLVMAEASTFPEIATFYQNEVVAPGHELIRRILQRGIDRGEFRDMPLDYAVYSLVAPMIFLLMWKHAMTPCAPPSQQIDPLTFIDTQVDLILSGMLKRLS